MKKIYLTVCVLTLTLIMLPAMALASPCSNPSVTPLVAGGGNEASGINVGEVRVCNDTANLYVTYKITEPGWCFTELHLQVASELGQIPQSRGGNPVPGKFKSGKYEGECATEKTFTIPLGTWTLDQILYIAAHAAIQKNTGMFDEEGNPVYQYETAWGKGPRFTTRKSWAMYFNYAVEGYKTVYWPGPDNNNTTTIAFEDLPLGNSGLDWDYNDWVGDVQVTALMFGNSTEGFNYLKEIQFTFTRQTKLAGYTHKWRLGENAFMCNGNFERTLNGVPVQSGFYNAASGLDLMLMNTGTLSEETATVKITFDSPCPFTFPDWDQTKYHGESLFFDPYLYVNNTGQTIHQGDVRMLTVPVDWGWPSEAQRIWSKYPKVSPAPNNTVGPIFVPYWWTP